MGRHGRDTVPAAKAGDGSAAVTGFTVSNIVYNLNATTTYNIDSVTFSLNTAPPAGTKIRIKLVSGGATWYTCTFVGTAVTCPTTAPQAGAVGANELRVVIAQ